MGMKHGAGGRGWLTFQGKLRLHGEVGLRTLLRLGHDSTLRCH